MRRPSRRWIAFGAAPLLALAAPAVIYLCLNYQPGFYRAFATIPRDRRKAEARQFVAQSLQLRNDIINEPRWEAAFTDAEVNAWLAEDLVAHFADLIPPGVHEPRVAFENDRVTLAFQLDRGPVRSLIWVVARVEVPEPNVLALTIEKIRAGMVPVSAEPLLGPITAHARAHGLDIRWDQDGSFPVALIRYQAQRSRADIVLEQLHLFNGQILLSGRSERRRGAVTTLRLPGRKALQMTFPRRKVQPASIPPLSTLRSSTSPPKSVPASRTATRSGAQARTS
jgi:hypothetical protein